MYTRKHTNFTLPCLRQIIGPTLDSFRVDLIRRYFRKVAEYYEKAVFALPTLYTIVCGWKSFNYNYTITYFNPYSTCVPSLRFLPFTMFVKNITKKTLITHWGLMMSSTILQTKLKFNFYLISILSVTLLGEVK